MAKISEIIENKNYKRVIFHLPSGLMQYAFELKKIVEDPIFLSTPNFGGCDIRHWFIKELNADALFLFAHTKPKKLKDFENIYFIDVQYVGKIPEFIPEENKIVLAYTAPFRKAAFKYKTYLEKNGKEILISDKVCSMCQYPGEMTGCDATAPLFYEDFAEAFVVVADGKFHSSYLASNTDKPVYNWLGMKAEKLKYPIAKLFMAKKIGIFTSIKPGQRYDNAVKFLKEKFEKEGKDVLVVYDDLINYELNNFPVDVWINAACPRISDDESFRNSIPLWYVLRHI